MSLRSICSPIVSSRWKLLMSFDRNSSAPLDSTSVSTRSGSWSASILDDCFRILYAVTSTTIITYQCYHTDVNRCDKASDRGRGATRLPASYISSEPPGVHRIFQVPTKLTVRVPPRPSTENACRPYITMLTSRESKAMSIAAQEKMQHIISKNNKVVLCTKST